MTASPPNPPDPDASDRPREPWTQVEIRRACKLLRILAEPHRLEILRALDASPKSVSGLYGEFPESTRFLVKRQLRTLRVAGLVEGRADGTFRIYSLTKSGRRMIRAVGGFKPT